MTHSPFEIRRLEIFFAMITAGFGVWLLRHPDSMASPNMVHVRDWMTETSWGALFLANGLMHGAWLAVNGARWWSPIIRFWAAFGSACLYLIWAVGIGAASPNGTGAYTYFALSLGAAWCCAFAWRDAVSAMRIHRVAAHPR